MVSESAREDRVDEAARAYIDGIAPEHRLLFDRLHNLVLREFPDVTVSMSYQMPTYRYAGRKLFIATWKHGVSIYGWDQGRAADFAASHPQLITGRGTIRLRPADADAIGDEVLRHLVRTALTP